MPDGDHDRIYRVVRRIPKGRVATYGQVAELAGIPRAPRQVGYALHALPEGSDVPWQRVVNAQGACSPRSSVDGDRFQRAILESEGLVFGPNGRLDLERCRWKPQAPRRRS